MLSEKMRVFIGLVEIAGYYSNLSTGLTKLGYDVKFAGAGAHIFNYGPGQKGCVPVDLFNFFLKKKTRTPRTQIVLKSFYALLVEISKVPLFIWSLFNCDIFIFTFGTTFFNAKFDLFILRTLNKKIIINIGHGSDARPPYIDGVHLDHDGKHLTTGACYRKSLLKRRKLNTLEKYADIIISSPFTAHFLKKPFINWYYLGVPMTHGSVPDQNTDPGVLQIVHAPSHPQVKGSARIKAAIETLRAEGLAINYTELSGRPNHEVIAAIRSSHLVIDQLYSDTPLAGLATEAAWQRRASVVGGYAWDILSKELPAEFFPPSLICDSEEFEQYLRIVLSNRGLINEAGDLSYKFVNEQWSIEQVSQRYHALIEGNFPDPWSYNPKDITYIHGVGIAESQLRDIIKGLIKEFGKQGLCLEHNPALEAMFVEFAKEKQNAEELL